jgi:hypothetical protein
MGNFLTKGISYIILLAIILTTYLLNSEPYSWSNDMGAEIITDQTSNSETFSYILIVPYILISLFLYRKSKKTIEKITLGLLSLVLLSTYLT